MRQRPRTGVPVISGVPSRSEYPFLRESLRTRTDVACGAGTGGYSRSVDASISAAVDRDALPASAGIRSVLPGKRWGQRGSVGDSKVGRKGSPAGMPTGMPTTCMDGVRWSGIPFLQVSENTSSSLLVALGQVVDSP